MTWPPLYYVRFETVPHHVRIGPVGKGLEAKFGRKRTKMVLYNGAAMHPSGPLYLGMPAHLIGVGPS